MLEPSYPLSTARMTLRPYEVGDLAAVQDLFGREDVSRYLFWEPMDIDAARALLERRLKQTRIEADGDGVLVAALDTETGRYIGEFMLRLTSAQNRQGEIGWSVHPDVQGRGLATEGAREMLRLGFGGLGSIGSSLSAIRGTLPRNGSWNASGCVARRSSSRISS